MKPNESWRENFFKKVTVGCKWCGVPVAGVHAGAVATHGVYCDLCRKDAKRESSRRYEARNPKRSHGGTR